MAMRDFRPRPGKLYRTSDFLAYARNPTRAAAQLVEAGKLRQVRKGLYYAPKPTAFGEAPPSEAEVLKVLLRGHRYLRTGPSVWNSLGLGSTSVEAVPLVYNTGRTGEVEVGRRRFRLRRVDFPRGRPPAEYFVVDLLENADMAGVERSTLLKNLAAAVEAGRFDAGRLLEMGRKYGSKRVQALLAQTLSALS